MGQPIQKSAGGDDDRFGHQVPSVLKANANYMPIGSVV
jgi:hypothetical protein